MSDRYVRVKIQIEDMKSLGEDAGREAADAEEQAPEGPPAASVFPDAPGVTVAAGDASRVPLTCKQRVKSRSTAGKDVQKHASDVPLHGSVVTARHLNRLGHERALHVRGTGKILRGQLEANGNYVNIHPSKNNQETRREDGFKLARKNRPVTVDMSKAKTSLEALKLSIKQLKWKEVCVCVCVLDSVLFSQCFVQVYFSERIRCQFNKAGDPERISPISCISDPLGCQPAEALVTNVRGWGTLCSPAVSSEELRVCRDDVRV